MTLPAIHDLRVAEGRITPDPGQRAALAALEDIRATLQATRSVGLLASLFGQRSDAPRGLYLWGAVGRGKSMLMDLFHAQTAIAGKRRVHFHAFMQQVQAALHLVRKSGTDDAILPVAEKLSEGLSLLCFDEMQVNDIADAMILGRLFQALFARGVTIVATSNQPPDALYKDGLNRALFLPFIDLLQENMRVLELRGPADYRQQRLAGAPVWFAPADVSADLAQDALWHDLTGGSGEPLVVSVNGREFILPEARSGVARASFAQLCGKPLGPGDYLATARAVRVLILTGIPILTGARHDEARRFVTLIDALYEAKVRLIATAEAPPERLYPEGRGSADFVRTASRLREMQAADWGAGAIDAT